MTSRPETIPFSFPGMRAVACLFSTAHAGAMSGADEKERETAAANRTAFKQAAGFELWAEAHQVHGDALVRANGGREVDPDALPRADGLYTFRKGEGLVIKTADCQPILFAREDGRAVAALHVGWRGNAMNFPGTAVERLCRLFDCGPDALFAVRGPSLGPAASEFVNFAEEWPEEFAPRFNVLDKTVNLWALTRDQLEQAGMRSDRIFSLDMCTRDMREHFFSYRRGDTGRQISAIWIRE